MMFQCFDTVVKYFPFFFFLWKSPVLKYLFSRITLLFIAIICKVLDWLISPSLLIALCESSRIVPTVPITIPTTSPVLHFACHNSSGIWKWYFLSFSSFLWCRYSLLDSCGQVTSMITQWISFSSMTVMSGLINSVPLHQVHSIWILLSGKLLFNSLPMLLTNLLCHSCISLAFILHTERMCWSSSISLRHLQHRFSSRLLQAFVLFIIVGRVDDKAWTHLTLFPTLNPLSDHSQPVGCLVGIMVLIAFPLLILVRFSKLLSAHVVFLLLASMLCNLRPPVVHHLLYPFRMLLLVRFCHSIVTFSHLPFSEQSLHLIATSSVLDLLLNGSNLLRSNLVDAVSLLFLLL